MSTRAKYRPKPVHWADLKPRFESDPHFQHVQFDPGLPRRGVFHAAGYDIAHTLSPEANSVVYGDKSIRGRIAHLLSEPCSVFEAAAFRV